MSLEFDLTSDTQIDAETANQTAQILSNVAMDALVGGAMGGARNAAARGAAHGAAGDGAIVGGAASVGASVAQRVAESALVGGAATVGRVVAQAVGEAAVSGGAATVGEAVGRAALEAATVGGVGAALGRVIRGDGACGDGNAQGRAIASAIQGTIEDVLNGKQTGRFEHLQNEKALDFQFNVTDGDRTRAKEVLSGELSELIPEADRNLMRDFQSSIIDGNLERLTATLRRLNAEPAKLDLFIRALNRQLDGHERFNGIDISRDSAGNVLVYDQNRGSTALQINPTSGEATVRAIEIQRDGSVLVRPGEIINRRPADVLRTIGDEATRAVVGPRIERYNRVPLDRGASPRILEGTESTSPGILRQLLEVPQGATPSPRDGGALRRIPEGNSTPDRPVPAPNPPAGDILRRLLNGN